MPEDTIFTSTPEQSKPGVSEWRPGKLELDWSGRQVIVTLYGWEPTGRTGHVLVQTYAGSIAEAIMVGLNSANLTTYTLKQRILDKLIADGSFTSIASRTVAP